MKLPLGSILKHSISALWHFALARLKKEGLLEVYTTAEFEVYSAMTLTFSHSSWEPLFPPYYFSSFCHLQAKLKVLLKIYDHA